MFARSVLRCSKHGIDGTLPAWHDVRGVDFLAVHEDDDFFQPPSIPDVTDTIRSFRSDPVDPVHPVKKTFSPWSPFLLLISSNNRAHRATASIPL